MVSSAQDVQFSNAVLQAALAIGVPCETPWSGATRFAYVYSPLSSQQHIRLLRVMRSQRERNNWLYELITTPLDKAPSFEAVSYVWGDPKRVTSVNFADGSFLGITESMQEALPVISRLCETSFLWIDQICIDQADKDERGHQVKLMGKVYEASSCVLIFLRSESPAMDDMHYLNQLLDRYALLDDVLPTDEYDIAVSKLLHISHEENNEEAKMWRSFVKFFHHTWFTRAWVVQEAVLSDPVFVVGEKKSHLRTFLRLALACIKHENKVLSRWTGGERVAYSAGFNRLYFIVREKDQREIKDQILRNFWDLLSDIAPTSVCSDPRDKIYAFLGLLDDHNVQIDPDYSNRSSTSLIFVQTAVALIQGSHSLEMLGLAVLRYSNDVLPSLNLPSWAPDWRKGERGIPISRTGWPLFSAAAGRFHTAEQSKSVSNQLYVRGKIIDKVAEQSEAFQFSLHNIDVEDIRGAIQLALMLHKTMSELGLQSSTEEEIHQSIARLLRVVLAEGIPNSSMNVKKWISKERSTELAIAYVNIDFLSQSNSVKHAADLEMIRDRMPVAMGRRIVSTKYGKLALVGSSVQQGDVIAILHGSKAPLILREIDREYRFLGQAYVEGMMYGEAVTWKEDEADEIILI